MQASCGLFARGRRTTQAAHAAMVHQNTDGAAWSLDDHRRCSEDLRSWYHRIEFYIEQVHAKKCIEKRGRYIPRSKPVDRLLRNWLFHGKQHRSTLDPFPSCFKSNMQSCMFLEHSGSPRCDDRVYYGVKHRDPTPSGEAAPEPLDDCPELTPVDIQKIKQMNEAYVAFMDRCIAHVKSQPRVLCADGLARMVAVRTLVTKNAARSVCMR